jgi:hypothetical protein
MINILKQYRPCTIKSEYLILSRSKGYRNHPGHKPKPLCVPHKYELPDEYVEEPMYPPVKPKYPTGFNFSNEYPTSKAWHYFNEGQKFNSLRTVQERLAVMAYLNIQPTVDDLGVTRIRHFPLLLLNTMPRAAQSSEQRQYITKTVLNPKTESNQTGQNATKTPAASIDAKSYKEIRDLVIACIVTSAQRDGRAEDLVKGFEQKDFYKPKSIRFEENLQAVKERNNLLVNDMFNGISAYLASSHDTHSHLRNAQYARNVNIEAYWKRCGYKETHARGCVPPDDDCVRYQYRDKALYQIKTDMPLKPVS